MSTISKAALLEAAKKLPPGHVNKKIAQEAIDLEYNESRALEKKWARRFGNWRIKSNTQADCQRIADTICNALAVNQVKVIVNSPQVHPLTAGHYANKQIHLTAFPSWTTVVHETAHHVAALETTNAKGHGKTFLWAENLCFEALFEHTKASKQKEMFPW